MRIMEYNYRGKKNFPFLPDTCHDELLSELWANKIHGQTLKRLNERGGMGITELLANIKKLQLRDIQSPTEADAKELLKYIEQYQQNLK